MPLDNDTVPCVSAVAETLDTVNTWAVSFGGPALSLPVSVEAGNCSVVSSSVVSVSLVADGASFTSVTVMLTVEVLESFAPSLTLKLKLSLPLKSCQLTVRWWSNNRERKRS